MEQDVLKAANWMAQESLSRFRRGARHLNEGQEGVKIYHVVHEDVRSQLEGVLAFSVWLAEEVRAAVREPIQAALVIVADEYRSNFYGYLRRVIKGETSA
jgi:hypothetical protein